MSNFSRNINDCTKLQDDYFKATSICIVTTDKRIKGFKYLQPFFVNKDPEWA